MTKKSIHRRFVDKLTAELKSITEAARNSFATATDEEHDAEGKYDTFKLESSYLARGQAKRVVELTHALESLQAMPLQKFPAGSPILLGALVRLKDGEGKARTVFIGPAAGGERVIVNDEEIMLVTSRSPLGQALLGKKVGEAVELQIGFDTHKYTVLCVE